MRETSLHVAKYLAQIRELETAQEETNSAICVWELYIFAAVCT
jgi:hypothetical protein